MSDVSITSRPLITAIVLSLCLSLGCIKRQFIHQTATQPSRQQTSQSRININSASADELEELPGIGKALAARIIEHREKFGPFRKTAHLIVVRGISDRRFRGLQDFITVE